MSRSKNTLFVLLLALLSCKGTGGQTRPDLPADPDAPGARDAENEGSDGIVVAASRTGAYFEKLKGKRFGLVANPTSVIFRADGTYTHLVDSLAAAGIPPVRVFAPEHGFRGEADAGEHVADGIDRQSGLPVVSLYGANRKPKPDQLAGLDLVLFDIQDVGVRFYTYIATLQLVMEACAEAGIPVLVLDRPNPNADFIDGPLMEEAHRGFLGMTRIPLVYGMTIGEYAGMINGEGWLEGGRKADLEVVELEGYRHDKPYVLPIPPSPNLPNQQAVQLYPSLGLFEGTNVNAGRGTTHQFQSFGAPWLDPGYFGFHYKPVPRPGAAHPKHEGLVCHGRDLREVRPPRAVDLSWLIEAYHNREQGSEFFRTAGFTKHAGTEVLQRQIETGLDMEAIRDSWKEDLAAFRAIRVKYLLYP